MPTKGEVADQLWIYWIDALPLAFSLTLSVLKFSYPLLSIIIITNQGRQSQLMFYSRIFPLLFSFLCLTRFLDAFTWDCAEWFEHGTSTYEVIPKTTFTVAVTLCERMGGSLFVPNSREEYEAIEKWLNSSNVSTQYYIGLALLSGDCVPKWQMPHGMDVDELEGLNNSQSHYLRQGMLPPVGILDSTNQSIRLVNSTHILPAICERNSSFVEYSAEDLAFTFWNTSYSGHMKRRSDKYYSNLDITFLCSHYAACADSAMWATPEHKAYLIGKMDPVMYKLAELDRNVYGILNIEDWYYNGDLLAKSLIQEDREIEYCESKMFIDNYSKQP